MTEFRPFDAAKHLDNPEIIAAYLEDAIETNDDAYIATAIGDVARARGMSDIADALGVSRPSLYRSLSQAGNASFTTIRKVLTALGVTMSVKPARQTTLTRRNARPAWLKTTLEGSSFKTAARKAAPGVSGRKAAARKRRATART